MKRIELLAPAGDFESLKAAIANGANAIYLGGNVFSARAYAKNFSREELKEAVAYAHLRDVRLYVTVNTLYKDDEFKELLHYIDYLYEIQIDALLIQDIGLLETVRQRYQDFEIHISTQMSVNSLEAVHFFENLGVSRIVLARENTIEEIQYICQHTDLEIEVFAHGALCVAYSGQCLMSSMIGKRSGNRGACAQPCRLPYKLEEDGRLLNNEPVYIMSPRDLCSAENIDLMIKAGISSLKIEGRMKKPEYVAAVVKTYAKAINHFYDHTSKSFDSDDFADMKQMFNRHYTNGYLFHDSKIVDEDFSGNRGILIGKVIAYDFKNKRAMISLENQLNQGDSVLFEDVDKGRPVNKIYKNGQLVNQGLAGDKVQIEFDYPVKSGNVRKTVSLETMQRLQKTYENEKKYRKISMTFIAHVGQPFQIKMCSGDHEIMVASKEIVEKAAHTPTTKERIIQQLSKLGSTIFSLESISVDIDETINVPISLLNQSRREGINALELSFSQIKIHHGSIQPHETMKKEQHVKTRRVIAVMTTKQLEACLKLEEKNVYYHYDEHFKEAIAIFKKHLVEPAFYLPRINNDHDLELMKDDIILNNVQHLIINDFGSYTLFKDRQVIIGTGLNVYNSHSASFYTEPVIASYECSQNQLRDMKVYNAELIMPIYGRVENMIMEHCMISQYYFHKKVKGCQKCKGHSYRLIDRKNVAFPLFTDQNCRNHVFNSKTLYIDDYRKMNLSTFLMFTNESMNEITKVLQECNKEDKSENHDLIKSFEETTIGYFKS